MFRPIAFCLFASTLLISGCVNRTPPAPTITPTQLNTALSETETRLMQSMAQQCEKWENRQSLQSEQLQQIEKQQRAIDNKLIAVEDKLDRQHSVVAAPATAKATVKAAECPPANESTAGVNNIGNKIVVGRVEWLWIEAVNRVYEARIDTGATTSSISALDITPFEKDGKRWVRFRLSPDDTDDSYEIEAPLVRYVRIRQASSQELDRRPVAALTVRLGKMTEVAEFTLTDRTQMSYPILLGREFLRDVAVVDVAKSTVQPKPEIVSGKEQPKSISKSKNK
jgi:hypothetical protein